MTALVRMHRVQFAHLEAAQLLTLAEQVRAECHHFLARAATIIQLLDGRAQADGLRTLFRQLLRKRRDRMRARNAMAEVVLRIERRLGEWLDAHINHSGGGDRRSQSARLTALRDLPEGVGKYQSSRWQKIAAISEAIFDRYLQDTMDEEGEVTGAGLFRFDETCRRGRDRVPRGERRRPELSRWRCACTTAFADHRFHARCERCGNTFVRVT
jgi:hypothetical protein